MTEQNKTKVPAELIPAGNYPVVSTDAVMDKQRGKTQEEVNTEAGEKIAALEESVGTGGSVDTRIENAVNTEKARAENVEAQLSNEIDVLQKQDVVPVDSLPSVADADPKKIYRVVGTTSYTDYMVDTMAEPTAWKTLSTYSFPGIDDTPTAGSNNLVKSGGVQNELALGAVYDVSAKNPTAGSNNDGKFESLSALLSDANINTLIPIAVRKGGMSIKFVQSSDNKYVQYMFTGTDATTADTFTNVANWEKVNLWEEVEPMLAHSWYEELTPSSTVLDKRIGTNTNITDINASGHDLKYFDVAVGKTYKIIVGKNTLNKYNTMYAYENTSTTVSLPTTQVNCPVTNKEIIIEAEHTKLIVSFDHGTICSVYEAVEINSIVERVSELESSTVKKTDIVDNLTTDNSSKPLSAKQGKILNDSLSVLSQSLNGYVSNDKIADNLATNDSTKVLSAKQGKILNDELTRVNDFIADASSAEYGWHENAEVDGNYSYAPICGKGNTIAENKTIYKVIISVGNIDATPAVTKLKMVLRKVYFNGEILATKIVDFNYTDTNLHDVEFDFTDSPVFYSGEIYCTCQANQLNCKFGKIANADYTYTAQVSNAQSASFEISNPFTVQASNTNALYVKFSDCKNTVLSVETDNIVDESVTEAKLSEEVQNKLNTPSSYNGIKVHLPSEIVVAAGSTLQLFYRGIVSAVNPYNYNIEVNCIDRTTGKTSGVALPRYYQFTCFDYCVIRKTTNVSTEPSGDNVTELNYAITNTNGYYPVNKVETSNSEETASVQAILGGLNNNDTYIFYIQESTTYTVWTVERRKNTGNLYDLTITVKDNNNNVIDSASSVIRTIIYPASSTQKNILLFGASVVTKGYIAGELRRRLTETTGGINTPINPLGLGLDNVSFIGRKTGTTIQDVHQEATGGWSWLTYASAGTPRYRFYVTDGSGNDVGVNETFVISGLTFTVKEKNIDGSTGNGNFSCTYTGTQSGDIPTTGTITFQGGNVNYSSMDAESTGNPFWNPNKTGGAGIDFKFYTDTYCNGATIDILVSHCGVNDIAGNTWNKNTTINSIKAIARAYKEYCITNSINGKFIISSIAVPDPTGGFGINYFADGAVSNYYSALLKLFELAQIFEDISKDEEFSSFVTYAPVMSESDGENMYPQTATKVNNRSTKEEMIGQNAYHPEELGHKIIADSIYQSICDVL